MPTAAPTWLNGYDERLSPPLYVTVHRPADGRCGAVVLVPPFAEEKKAAHRGLVETAWRLAALGWVAVRFDFRGTGDSGGRFGDFDLQTRLADLREVIELARGEASGGPLALIGLRLGAALAWLAGDERLDRLVLWEPVTSGRAYMQQNRRRSQIRAELTGGESGGGPATEGFDFDGFAVSRALAEQLEGIDLGTAPLPPCPCLLLQISGAARIKKPYEVLAERLRSAGRECELDTVAVEPFWSSIGLVDVNPVIDRTIAWLGTGGQPRAAGDVSVLRAAEPVALSNTVRATALQLGAPAISAVLYEPAGGPRHGRGVVLLHGWSGYRIGPARLLTEAARALAEEGYAALSFDFRGRGESAGEVTAASLKTMIADAAEMAKWLLDQPGIERATLLGICSGGEVAIGASLSDPQIDSLVLWSTPVFSGEFTVARQARRSRKALVGYLRKLFMPETWRKLFAGELNWRLIRRAALGGRSAEDAGVADKAPDTGAQMAAFEAFPGRLLFIYGGSDPEAPPAWEFYRSFCGRSGLPYRYHEVVGSNHNFYSMAWKEEILAVTLKWLSETAGVP